MGKQDILYAAKRKGLEITQATWEWTPTPGESVPVWSIYFSADSADKFGIDAFRQFANTTEALAWIEDLEPLPETVTGNSNA